MANSNGPTTEDSLSGQISTLEQVPIRRIWPREEADFSVWLVDNLDYLNDHLEVALVSGELEVQVGNIRVDILAEDEQGRSVVIENQLKRSDHDHLGKAITYTMCHDAKVVIWITPDPREEHIRTVALLNDEMRRSFYLFEVAAYRINGSAPAIQFIKRAGPSVARRGAVAERETDEAKRTSRTEFFTMLLAAAQDAGVLTHAKCAPTPGPRLGARAFKGSGWATLVYTIQKREVSVAFEVDMGQDRDEDTKLVFDEIMGKRAHIEAQIGQPLDWDAVNGDRKRKVKMNIGAGGLDTPSRWEGETVPQAVKAMGTFFKVFSDILDTIDLTQVLPDSGGDDSDSDSDHDSDSGTGEEGHYL